jgi:hypothetical protein
MCQQQCNVPEQYAPILFYTGEIAIICALLLGAALAVAAIFSATKKSTIARADLPNPAPVIDSIRALIQALASAPAWIALFGGGILLVWIAIYATASSSGH